MPTVIFGLCIAVSFFLFYVVYTSKKESDKFKKINESDKKYLRLYMIEYAYTHYKNNLSLNYQGFRKMLMFETMNKSMSILKSCLQQLIREGIIEEKDEVIKITKFGKKYYEKILGNE